MPNLFEQNRRNRSLAALVVGMLMGASASADVLDTAVQVERNTNQQAAQAQQRIDNLSEQTEDLIAEYRRVVRELESLNVYNEQLEQVVNNQRVEIQSINSQLETLEETNQGVVPLMVEMIDMLEQVVEADLPFRLEERRNVVAELQDLLYRADVTTSEKYRRVMEAYQREIDFGRNVAAYEGNLPGTDRTVTFLKVGRALLYYQTLDGEVVGWYNRNTGQWEELDGKFNTGITNAIRIAKSQEAPNLVTLPVPGAEAAQ